MIFKFGSEGLGSILSGIATLLWPLLVFVVVILFRKNISDLLNRITAAEMFGAKAEFKSEMENLASATELAAAETTAISNETLLTDNPPDFETIDPVDIKAEAPEPTPELPEETARRIAISFSPAYSETWRSIVFRDTDKEISRILMLAANDPKVALISLSALIEKTARQTLASHGKLGQRTSVPLREALSELLRYGLPETLFRAFNIFSDVRAKIVHGSIASSDEAVRAIEYGITLLDALKSLWKQALIVLNPDLPLYGDAELTKPWPPESVKGIVLERHVMGKPSEVLIYPTRQTGYTKGDVVSRDWIPNQSMQKSYYKSPDTGTAELAFEDGKIFIGRPMREI